MRDGQLMQGYVFHGDVGLRKETGRIGWLSMSLSGTTVGEQPWDR